MTDDERAARALDDRDAKAIIGVMFALQALLLLGAMVARL